jgi:hypothetical protein
MKKLILVILFICVSSLLYGIDNNIYITQSDKIIGRFTPEQFETLVQGADKYKEIMLAQVEKRVNIVCSEIKETDIKGEYKTNIRIIWINKNNMEINFIEVELILNIDNDTSQNIPEWRIVYRDLSEIGFPITGGLLILILVLFL